MSDQSNVTPSRSDQKISVTDVLRLSYTYFIDHFLLFIKLSILPMLLWIALKVLSEILHIEYGIKFNHLIARAFVSAAFVLVWYRKFLWGMEHGSYGKLYDHLRTSRTINIATILYSILRIIIIAVVIFVPILITSLAAVVYQI